MNTNTDLRIQKTYLALHNAFTELLEESTFEHLTVNELCDRAMIRRATFYKHFADKYEYFSHYTKETAEAFREQYNTDTPQNDIGNYLQVVSAIPYCDVSIQTELWMRRNLSAY